MKVCFHTNGHLGDFIITIPFLKLLMGKYPENEYYQYVHGMEGTRYPDIFLKTVPNLKPTEEISGDVIIPTHFCDPIYEKLHLGGQAALDEFYPYDMISIQKYYWKHVYKNNNFEVEIPDNLGLDFDYDSLLDKEAIDSIKKIGDNPRKKILFVNIKGRSGQTDNEDWLNRISNISTLYPEWDYYYMNEESVEVEKDNVIHTPSIFGTHPSDLIHNSYLSTFCDIIIARNSGAFMAISMQNKNVMNENKTFITQTQDNPHVPDLECFYNRTLYKATNVHTHVSQETFLKLEEILWSCQ